MGVHIDGYETQTAKPERIAVSACVTVDCSLKSWSGRYIKERLDVTNAEQLYVTRVPHFLI